MKWKEKTFDSFSLLLPGNIYINSMQIIYIYIYVTKCNSKILKFRYIGRISFESCHVMSNFSNKTNEQRSKQQRELNFHVQKLPPSVFSFLFLFFFFFIQMCLVCTSKKNNLQNNLYDIFIFPLILMIHFL